METKSTFEQLFEDNSFFRQLVEQKIANEVAIVSTQKDKQIADLQAQVDELTTAVLMGGNANA